MRSRGKFIISYLLLLVLTPALCYAAFRYAYKSYYLISLIIIMASILAVVLSFENTGFVKERKQSVSYQGETLIEDEIAYKRVALMILMASISVIAVVARIAFFFLPQIKPMAGIIMIGGMCLGARAGFFIGSISIFVSNFFGFGQGIYTPGQMFAFGIMGMFGGLLAKAKIVSDKRPLVTATAGFIIIMLIVGVILDTTTILTMGATITPSLAMSIYLAGVPFNLIHALATFATLLILVKPMSQIINKAKIKYKL